MQERITESQISTSQLWGVDRILIAKPNDEDSGVCVYEETRHMAQFSSPGVAGRVRHHRQVVIDVADPDAEPSITRIKAAIRERMIAELRAAYTLAHAEATTRATEMRKLVGRDPQALMRAHEWVEEANARRDALESHLQSMTLKRD